MVKKSLTISFINKITNGKKDWAARSMKLKKEYCEGVDMHTEW
jgi:hypothetical protein